MTCNDHEIAMINHFGVCTGWGASGDWLIEGQLINLIRLVKNTKIWDIKLADIIIIFLLKKLLLKNGNYLQVGSIPFIPYICL